MRIHVGIRVIVGFENVPPLINGWMRAIIASGWRPIVPNDAIVSSGIVGHPVVALALIEGVKIVLSYVVSKT